MEKILYILRACPGAGKSTFAKTLGTKAICTADDYMMHDGKYNWSYDNAYKAHKWCQRKCMKFMRANAERIVIANTNTTEKDMLPYSTMAELFGYKVFYIVIENRHNGVNEHNVPKETLENMKNRLMQNIKL
jgi:predicted kinase